MLRNLIIIIFLFITPALAADPPMQLYDEGVLLGTVFKLNCVGSGVVCTKSGITGIITVGAVANNYMLMEDNSFLLLEDSGKIILE